MKLVNVASMTSENESDLGLPSAEDVVEVGILLPANRARELIQIARSRRESVGHLLRKMIDRELAASRCSG